jgi:hypothetical protein
MPQQPKVIRTKLNDRKTCVLFRSLFFQALYEDEHDYITFQGVLARICHLLGFVEKTATITADVEALIALE